MKKTTLIVLIAAVCVVKTNAQLTVKKDLVAYYTMLPAMPSTMQDAYAKCKCNMGACNADSLVAPLKRNIKADENVMGTLTTNNTQQLANAKQINQDVKGMNDNQKLEYAKNNPTMNGGGANQAQYAFAQKMQDPAEKAKLQAMSPQEKMAYLQQNGMLGGMAMPGGAPKPTPADDPKMDSALTTAKRLQYTRYTDKMKMVNAVEFQVNTARLDSAHNVLGKQQGAEVAALPHYSGNESGVDPVKYTAINTRYLQKNIQLAATELQTMTKAYNDLFAWLKANDTPYNTAVAAANYGYTSTGGQDDNIATLASAQGVILTDVNTLSDYAKSIYEFGAYWQDRQVQAQK